MTKKQSEEPAKFKIHGRLNPLHPADDVTMDKLRGEWGETWKTTKPFARA